MKTSHKAALTCAGIVTALAVVWMRGIEGESELLAAVDSKHHVTHNTEGNSAHKNNQLAVEADAGVDAKHQDASIERTIQLFDEWKQYPANSRPLSEDMYDLVHYERVDEPYGRAISRDTSGQLQASNYRCQMQPALHTLNSEITRQKVSFYCKDDAGQNIVMDIVDMKADGSNPNTSWNVDPSAFTTENSTRESGAGRVEEGYAIHFDNAKASGGADWGDIRLSINYSHPEDHDRVFTMTKSFSFSSESVAGFSGNYREEIKDGSLVIYAEIDIDKPGNYKFKANLKNDSSYISVASHQAKYEPGTHQIPFLFYGKIFHDKQADGPYTLTGVRGNLINLPFSEDILNLPGEEFLAAIKDGKHAQQLSQPVPVGRDYLTQEYYYEDDFSGASYQSEENSERRDMLERLVEAN
ncbi:MAG: hypothetical protein COA42_05060 [Alteromonadaceae bacterium]|nr:MAG: hypothetical protein COA42_05060 [Alteromonadaceae bacterium]